MLSDTTGRRRGRRAPTLAALRRLTVAVVATLIVFLPQAALGAPEGRPDYRTMFSPDGRMGFLDPRLIMWIFAELHLLFAAFVLAVPMFVVIIEIVGILSKDPVQSRRYDDLAHGFCRLLTTAFSLTSILGAILTFAGLYLYPRMFSHLVDVFGPTMYLYALIFFGESFSLYIYYYGWGKIRRWVHAAIGIALNAIGIGLMLIANAWTSYTMAPAGLNEAGVVVDRSAAFWNFLLHPINIHRLIANLCMGGSVAGAYAAYSFLTTKDPEKRAHYDWMGYVGNFVAILALLPLPFAGYYLGFEIYQYNQQLGVYMMGGVLSWFFIMQAVLIGSLFFAANYYLWLGMDRIEGSERYRGWIKWMLGVITICMLIWATPHSLILTSEEIGELGGISHPILSIFGVMSAKNTAVNLVILTTFLSFVLYRRSNKVPTVSWARTGKMVQALAFGATAAAVIVIGIGGYVPSMWLESAKRIAMSPWQVLAVLACMIVVMIVDVLMFRGAKEVGAIHWGRVSNRAQYCLIFLAVTFTWLMGLMGFIRSSLRQHWHVYEVVKDTSPWAFTPALGYATLVVTFIVMIFFGLVALVIWVTDLGAQAEKEFEGDVAVAESAPINSGLVLTYAVAGGLIAVSLYYGVAAWLRSRTSDLVANVEEAAQLRAKQNAELEAPPSWVDKAVGLVSIPIGRATEIVTAELSRNPELATPAKPAPRAQPDGGLGSGPDGGPDGGAPDQESEQKGQTEAKPDAAPEPASQPAPPSSVEAPKE